MIAIALPPPLFIGEEMADLELKWVVEGCEDWDGRDGGKRSVGDDNEWPKHY